VTGTRASATPTRASSEEEQDEKKNSEKGTKKWAARKPKT